METDGRADFGTELSYWVEDGKPDPVVDWPDNWEVCGVPYPNPFAVREEDKREGRTTLAWPMYCVPDLVAELERICAFLERMPEVEMEKWLGLQDRSLTFSCRDREMDAAEMDAKGFTIPGAALRRARRLRIRLTVGFHPSAAVIRNVAY